MQGTYTVNTAIGQFPCVQSACNALTTKPHLLKAAGKGFRDIGDTSSIQTVNSENLTANEMKCSYQIIIVKQNNAKSNGTRPC